MAPSTNELRAHLIVGGFPIGSSAGHDMDFARISLLQKLYDGGFRSTVANDFSDVATHLSQSRLLVTYVAGPYPDEIQTSEIEDWMREGGRWFALHGTSGGRAARVEGSRQRQMVRLPHHDALGAFFLNHPPLCRFRVSVKDLNHPVMSGLPSTFEVTDELYMVEPLGDYNPLLTTEMAEDPSPPGFGFLYDEDTSVRDDGKTRVIGLERKVGEGGVVYVALGHCHSPATNAQPLVDESVNASRESPRTFRGSWTSNEFDHLVSNAIAWAAN